MKYCLIFFCLFAFLAGCSESKDANNPNDGPSRSDELQEVLSLLSTHTGQGRKTKPTERELMNYEQGYPAAVELIRSNEVVVIWGVSPAGEGEIAAGGGGTEIVAYEKKVETEKGWVILQNGTTKEMTSTEFAAATKAKK